MDLRVVEIGQSTPHPDEPFDCIAAMDVLEHAESFEDSLGRIVAKLKRDGYLAISSPMDSWLRKLFGRFDKDEGRTSQPRKSRLRELVQEHNLTVTVENKYTPMPVRQKIPLVPA